MPLAVNDLLFDVKNERPFISQNSLQFRGDGQKPFDILIRVDAAVGILSTVGIGGRRDNQINAVIR